MIQALRPIKYSWTCSRGAVVSAMLVLLAVFTLPGCPRLSASFLIGQDVQTVTENRDIVETFSSPGHFLLHGISSTSAICEECGTVDSASSDQQRTVAPVLTVDVTNRDTAGVAEPRLGDIADAHDAGSDALPVGYIAQVPARPPRW